MSVLRSVRRLRFSFLPLRVRDQHGPGLAVARDDGRFAEEVRCFDPVPEFGAQFFRAHVHYVTHQPSVRHANGVH